MPKSYVQLGASGSSPSICLARATGWACEDANSKLVEVVTVVDVDDEKSFDDSCMQIWKLKFGHEAKFCSDFEHKVWSRV